MASHSQVAHRFAQDSGSPIKGYNLFFERRENGGPNGGPIQTIFSHGTHFPLASFVTDANGRRVVLGNFSERRSVSTSQHQSEVRSAIPSGVPVFDVPFTAAMYMPGGSHRSPHLHPSVDQTRGHASEYGFHGANLKALLERAADNFAKGKRARSDWKKDMYARDAAGALKMARDYAEAFAVTDFAIPADLDATAAEVERMESEAREAREAARAEQMAAQREADAEAFAAWLRGEPGSRCPSSYRVDASGAAYVRRSPDGESLQTSQGADVPWPHAVKAFRFIRLCRESGEAFQRNGRTIRVGHFQVDAIDAKGNMTAGCHRFAWESMAALAEREGVFALAPSADAVETSH